MQACSHQPARLASILAVGGESGCARWSLLDSALGWSGIEEDGGTPKGEKVVAPGARANVWGLARGKDVDVAKGPPKVPEGGGGEKKRGGGGELV